MILNTVPTGLIRVYPTVYELDYISHLLEKDTIINISTDRSQPDINHPELYGYYRTESESMSDCYMGLNEVGSYIHKYDLTINYKWRKKYET